LTVSGVKVASILLMSTLRDLGYLLFGAALPLLLSSVTGLFKDGLLPWPFLVLMALCDASAIGAWLGDLRRNYLTLSARATSIALAVTSVGLLVWGVRVLMMLAVRLVVAPELTALSLQAVLLNGAMGMLLTSLLLLSTAGWGSRTPWAVVLSLLTITYLFGTPIWVSELSDAPDFRSIVAAESDVAVATGTSLALAVLSLFFIVVVVWVSRSKTLQGAVQSG